MTSEYIVRLAVAAMIGAAIGAEREFRDKAAGLRTIMLICIGSCLFTILGEELTLERGDPVRIPSSIVSGVGFLGAGVIFRRGIQSTGITTAATIWCSAALGMASGGGRFALALTAAGGVLAVLWVLPPLERFIDNRQEAKTYLLHTSLGALTIDDIHGMFDGRYLKVIRCSHGKSDGMLVSELDVLGPHDEHTRLTHELIDAEWLHDLSL